MVEYILVLFVVVSAFLFISKTLKSSRFFYKRFTEPLVKHMAYNYKYADSEAQGWDEGDPSKHIQIQDPEGQTFRLFQVGTSN